MRNIYKAHCARLFTDKLFIVGTVLAFAITFWFTKNGTEIRHFGMYKTDFDYALTASLGLLGFFSVFTPLFLGTEYSDGTIKNKLISGRTRTQIYLSSLAAILTALLVMTAAWAAGAFLGANTLPDAEFIAVCIVRILLYNAASVSIFVMMSMTISKKTVAATVEALLFQFSVFLSLALTGIMANFDGLVSDAAKVLVNVMPCGQWHMFSLIGDEEMMTISTPVHFIMSAAIICVMCVSGLILVQKKEIQ